MPLTPLSKLLQSTKYDGDSVSLAIPEDWRQGRSVFGGLQVAVALQAMRKLVPDVQLRTVQATFVGPANGKVQGSARILRRGKSAIHVEARMTDGDETVLIVIGVFGTKRRSQVSVIPQVVEHPFVTTIDLPFIPGVTPNFIQHFQVRWQKGLPPYTGDTARQHIVEISLKDEGRMTEGHLMAFADFIPPLALSHLRDPAPSSTLTWLLEIIHDQFAQFPLASWRVDAELLAAQDGYTSQAVMLSAPGGIPVALSRQSMLIFESNVR